MRMLFIIFSGLLFCCSCKSKPSEEDISKKILLEYLCPGNAKVENLKVIQTKVTESVFGFPALQYTVSGEIEWVDGCDETFGNIPAGYKESFKNKIIILVKTGSGWQ